MTSFNATTQNPANDHSLMMWDNGKTIKLPFADFLIELWRKKTNENV